MNDSEDDRDFTSLADAEPNIPTVFKTGSFVARTVCDRELALLMSVRELRLVFGSTLRE
jgi:hypothetical protein